MRGWPSCNSQTVHPPIKVRTQRHTLLEAKFRRVRLDLKGDPFHPAPREFAAKLGGFNI